MEALTLEYPIPLTAIRVIQEDLEEIALTYPLPFTALTVVVPARFIDEPIEPGNLQTSEGEDFTFNDGSTRTVNPG